MSDGVKQSLIAVGVIGVGVLLLLSFGGLAGAVGEMLNTFLGSILGWGRWFFAVVLLVLGWHAIFPDQEIFHKLRIAGLVFFFLSFSAIVHMLFVGTETPEAGDLIYAGGYLGMFVSQVLVGAMNFWGAFVVVLAVFFGSVFLVFEVSLSSLLALPDFVRSLPFFGRDEEGGRGYDEEEEEDNGVDDEEDEEGDEAEEEVEEKRGLFGGRKKRKAAGPAEGAMPEQVVTSKRRRKMEIPIDLLDDNRSEPKAGDISRCQEIIERTLANFGIHVEMSGVRVGPTVTQYAFRPADGVKLSRILALHNDLALALAAHPIRIEAPIPGKSLVGIEVPNQKVGSVGLAEMLMSKEFKRRKSPITAALGKDVAGITNVLAVDKAPHMLVAGATGSGKSVCLNVIIASLLYTNGPDDLKFIFVDPKRVELGVYAGIPHLLVPPIVKSEEAVNALKWAVREMERRLDHLAKVGVRDIDSYNAKNKERMPKVVIILDELADLMTQNKREVEASIVRIAQMARAVGIHLILATQRPSVDVITGIIKANIPTRIACSVASQVDSKTILDVSGAEKLLGRGDMLVSTPQSSTPKRMQGAYVSDGEIERIVAFLKEHGEPDYNHSILEDTKTGGTVIGSGDDGDVLMESAIQVAIESGKASTSFLQRRLKIGYSRAARIIDLMEDMGIIGPSKGSKPRDILVDQWPLDSAGAQVSFDEGSDEDALSGEVDRSRDVDDSEGGGGAAVVVEEPVVSVPVEIGGDDEGRVEEEDGVRAFDEMVADDGGEVEGVEIVEGVDSGEGGGDGDRVESGSTIGSAGADDGALRVIDEEDDGEVEADYDEGVEEGEDDEDDDDEFEDDEDER